VPAVDALTGRMTFELDPLGVVAVRIDGVVNADADGDGRVGGDDLLMWQRHLGRADASGPGEGDFNYDGVVDDADLALWRSRLNSAMAAAAASSSSVLAPPVPEPVGVWPMACGAARLMTCRRRRASLWRGAREAVSKIGCEFGSFPRNVAPRPEF
jgi:hypothetical protein